MHELARIDEFVHTTYIKQHKFYHLSEQTGKVIKVAQNCSGKVMTQFCLITY